MTSPIDLCNRALSEIGARSTIAAFEEGSKEARTCALWYEPLRRQLLRAAPWGFSRAQAVLSELGSATAGSAPYPWGFKYTLPTDALRIRYLLPPGPNLTSPTVPPSELSTPYNAPSRANRFIIANDTDPVTHLRRRVVLSNLQYAQAVYVIDENDVSLFDDMFAQALVSSMAAKICLALTGNAGMRPQFIQSAMDAVMNARAADGNEAMPTTDHTPDWIAARGVWNPGVVGFGMLGDWYVGWDDMSWGM